MIKYVIFLTVLKTIKVVNHQNSTLHVDNNRDAWLLAITVVVSVQRLFPNFMYQPFLDGIILIFMAFYTRPKSWLLTSNEEHLLNYYVNLIVTVCI